MIFTYTDARFYVNGKACGTVGKIERVGGTVLYWSQVWPGRIRPCLITGQAPSKVLTAVQKARLSLGTIVIDPGHGGRSLARPVRSAFERRPSTWRWPDRWPRS